VGVHTIVKEGHKERIQVFSGITIVRRASGINQTFVVREISYGEGVERVFDFNSPIISKITVDCISKILRSKLYYVRMHKGKSAGNFRES
jgi:large subunit ribosomal protein L19